MIYYSWKRSGTEVLDCELPGNHYLHYFISRPDLGWRRQTHYIPIEDRRALRVPDLYLTLIGVPTVENSKTP